MNVKKGEVIPTRQLQRPVVIQEPVSMSRLDITAPNTGLFPPIEGGFSVGKFPEVIRPPPIDFMLPIVGLPLLPFGVGGGREGRGRSGRRVWTYTNPIANAEKALGLIAGKVKKVKI